MWHLSYGDKVIEEQKTRENTEMREERGGMNVSHYTLHASRQVASHARKEKYDDKEEGKEC